MGSITHTTPADASFTAQGETEWEREHTFSLSTADISGLGTIATQNSNNVTITGGSITGITDLAVADGGTGASTFTANQILYGNGTSPITSSANLTFDGTTLQTAAINGGAVANADITIQGTSHATRTTSYVNLQPNGGNVGIGTTSPAYGLTVGKNGTQIGGTNFYGNAAFQDAGLTKGFVYGYNNSDSSGIIAGNGNVDMAFWSYNGSAWSESMRIDSATGNVGIGTTGPTAVLHLKAGTATASTAPLKLTAGTNNTVPEAGAIEFDGTDLYFTV